MGPCKLGCVSRAGDLGCMGPGAGVLAVGEYVTSYVLWPPLVVRFSFLVRNKFLKQLVC